jgi:Xaa-Pro aminopeptidase
MIPPDAFRGLISTKPYQLFRHAHNPCLRGGPVAVTVVAEDGSGAARIEEEVVVTEDGCQIITNFPSDRLISCGLV